MKNEHRIAFILALVFSSTVAVGCGPEQHVTPPQSIESLEPTCIQGTVSYRLPEESRAVPFANVKVTAWRHNTKDQPFAEVVADARGNYCLEVPLGEHGVDVRVWGMVTLGNKSYTCTASEDDIKLGKTTKKCGSDCATLDLVASCSEFRPTRRLGK